MKFVIQMFVQCVLLVGCFLSFWIFLTNSQFSTASSDLCVQPVLHTDNDGLIQSHKFYTFHTYPNNLTCNWLIVAPKNYQIMIQFNFIEIEDDKFCQYDFIEFVTLYNQSYRRCGNDDNDRFISPENQIKIKFYSDGSASFGGFQLRYHFVLSINVRHGFVSSRKYNYSCADDEWKCNYGNICIPKNWVCDNVRDCRDNSDELFCETVRSCHQSQMSCLNGRCISKELWCNGISDCEDDFDENNCNHTIVDLNEGTTKNECSFQYIKPKYVDINNDNPQIVGGLKAIPGSWPWIVSLRYGLSHMCGGSLISDRWVLSAGHCFAMDSNPKYWAVDLGRYFLYFGSIQSIPVEDIIIHPQFRIGSVDFDIALLKLKHSVTLTPSIQTVCLPETEREPIANQKCTILGWGYTKDTGGDGVLKQAVVPIVDRSLCNKQYENIITNQMICAGYLKGGVDSCNGDSGGPLVCNNGKKFILYGITSWGDGCALPNKPGVYTNVVNFVSWIKNITSQELSTNTSFTISVNNS